MRRNIWIFVITFVFLSAMGPRAFAIPSYARQTGLPCSGCHYTPPELNAAGRLFKLMGYIDKVKDDNLDVPSGPRRAGLDILKTLPLSAWLEASNTSTNKPQPGTQNSSFEFPQDISLFLAGAWTTHVGSFLQVTYSVQDDHFSMDNTDVRYANRVQRNGKDWVYGLTLNNNPTVEDLWNSTPAWGYPFIASDSAPTPTAAPIIQGLGQDVAGLGAFTMWVSTCTSPGQFIVRIMLASASRPAESIPAMQPCQLTSAASLRTGALPGSKMAALQTSNLACMVSTSSQRLEQSPD